MHYKYPNSEHSESLHIHLLKQGTDLCDVTLTVDDIREPFIHIDRNKLYQYDRKGSGLRYRGDSLKNT